MKVKDLIKQLKEDGWEMIRVESSHHTFKKAGVTDIITVPGKPNDEVKAGTLGQIKRKAGWR